MLKNTTKWLTLLLIVTASAILIDANAAVAQNQKSQKELFPTNLNQLGIRQLQNKDPNLLGKDVNIALIARSFTYINSQPQNDYLPNRKHKALLNSEINYYDDKTKTAKTSPHSTAICSILTGSDPNAFYEGIGHFEYRGIIPEANLDVYEFWHFLTNNAYFLKPPRAEIITAAFGSQFEDWWTNAFDKLAQDFGSTIIASIGNGTNAHDTPLYPAALPNTIGVGVIDSVNADDTITKLKNYAIPYPENSTFGPTIDDRCKPDIVAPGNCLVADSNNNSLYKPTGSGTSFAAPLVAGTAAMLLQKAKSDPNNTNILQSYPANCFIKAILLNSAKKLPFWHKGNLTKADDHAVPLDYLQGAGMLNPKNAYDNLIAGQNSPGLANNTGWDLNLIKNKAQANLYQFQINEPNDKIISATAVWNFNYNADYPFAPAPEKNSNLRLELWAVNPNEPNDHYLLDYSDSKNDNLEHIYTNADPNYHTYEIILSDSKYDPNDLALQNQKYAIAWSTNTADNNDSIYRYDLNADGIVNQSDAGKFLNNWINSFQSPGHYSLGDINADCIFDANDLQELLKNKDRKATWYNDPNQR